MPLTTTTTTAPAKPQLKNNRSNQAATFAKSAPLYAAEEILAYIAIRDQLLVEAEKKPTTAKMDSVLIANEFVEGCLKPARSPYEMQCLSEAAAQKERKRCSAVNDRVKVLRKGAA